MRTRIMGACLLIPVVCDCTGKMDESSDSSLITEPAMLFEDGMLESTFLFLFVFGIVTASCSFKLY